MYLCPYKLNKELIQTYDEQQQNSKHGRDTYWFLTMVKLDVDITIKLFEFN